MHLPVMRSSAPDPVLFTSASGPTLRVEFRLEPVISLRHEVVAAHRIARAVSNESTGETLPVADVGRLHDDDVARIDSETFALARTRLDDGAAKVVILPTSFHTVASRKGRRLLTDALGDVLKVGVMLELMDVERGTPVGRLTEVAGLAGSLCRGVLVRLSAGRDMIAPVRGYRPHGLTVEAAADEDDAQLASQLLLFADQGRGAAPTLMVFGLPNDGFFAVASVGGVTHASVRAEPVDQVRSAA
jgi:hypothetical protein